MIPAIIANWKMNFTLSEGIKLCDHLANSKYADHLVIAAPTPYLAYFANNYPAINFCAQDVSRYHANGAYTGEYSAAILNSCGINYCIVGHSERRTLFNENNKIVYQKATNIIAAHMTPIVCIGEPLKIRLHSDYQAYLLEQLKHSVPNCRSNFKGELIIAYEPIWSIGTGYVPSDQQLCEAFEIIHSYTLKSKVAKKIRLVYGGSVNQSNINKILNIKNVSGVLIGKAALNYENLVKIIDKVI